MLSLGFWSTLLFCRFQENQDMWSTPGRNGVTSICHSLQLWHSPGWSYVWLWSKVQMRKSVQPDALCFLKNGKNIKRSLCRSSIINYYHCQSAAAAILLVSSQIAMADFAPRFSNSKELALATVCIFPIDSSNLFKHMTSKTFTGTANYHTSLPWPLTSSSPLCLPTQPR